MNLPSRKTLSGAFGIEAGKKLRRLLEGFDSPEDYESVSAWIRQCYNRPSHGELVMEAANEIIGGFGVEAIWPNGESAGSCVPPIATYVNTGDTYSVTLLRDETSGRYRVTSWGDFVEARGL